MTISAPADLSTASETKTPTPRALMLRRALEHKGFIAGVIIVGALILVALLAPWLAPHDPFAQSLAKRLLPPVSLGVCAGYFGGWVDHSVSFLLTAQLALPGLLLAMALVFIIGPSVWVVIGIIGVLHWTYFLVVTRSATQRLKSQDFVAAAKAMGATRWQILRTEILPNLSSQIIVIFTFELGISILAESSLSFLGVGIQPPTPSWGLMIAEGKQALFYRPWLVILPGVSLFLLVIGANLLGDGLRDITSPQGRN